MKPIFKFLPPKPSEFLEELCANVRAIDNKADFVVHMHHWWVRNERTNTCYVCLAGAWMASKLGWRNDVEDLQARFHLADKFGLNKAAVEFMIDRIDYMRYSSKIGSQLSKLYNCYVPPPTETFVIKDKNITPLLTYISELKTAGL